MAQIDPIKSLAMQRFLVVRGKGGLGNRLLALAKILNQLNGDEPRLLVEWNDRYYADSPARNVFPSAFDLIHPAAAAPRRSVDIPEIRSRQIVPPCWDGHLGEEVYGNVDDQHRWTEPGYWHRAPASVLCSDEVPVGGIGIYCRLAGSPPVASRHWFEAKRALTTHVRLTETWRERIDCEAERLFRGYPVTGVHVRFGAPQKRLDLRALWRRLDKVADADAYIFLATDNKGVQQAFEKRFGDRLKVSKKWFSSISDSSVSEGNSLHRRLKENDPVSAERIFQEAVMDLFLLASCNILVCQPNSAFSQIAEFYSRAEKIYHWGQGGRFHLYTGMRRVIRSCHKLSFR